MINILDKHQCCGCTACASICVHNAIDMIPDALGFLYPKVNLDKCINCGLCEKVCAFSSNYDKTPNFSSPITLAARHKDITEVETSRSGAVFVALSNNILRKGGVVYGVGFKNHFQVTHKRATTTEERNEFKGSKYVQSDLRGIFQQVKQDLIEERTVLFSGTPCQTAGLRSFLNKRLKSNLILVDILCHGVPSPYVWRDYLDYLEKTHGSTIIKVNFRNKTKFGWEAHRETFDFKDGERDVISPFRFYQNSPYRKSCDICPYTNTLRPSDITLGDFWGWEKSVPSMNLDNRGVSLILCNTAKGEQLFSEISSELDYSRVDIRNCLQPQLCEPSKQMVLRDRYEKDYAKFGFEYVMNRYSYDNISYRMKDVIYRLLRKLHIYDS